MRMIPCLAIVVLGLVVSRGSEAADGVRNYAKEFKWAEAQAKEKVIGMWTDNGTINALALMADGEMWMDCSNGNGARFYSEGRWQLENADRLELDFGAHNSTEKPTEGRVLFAKIAFVGNEMIHTPEQGQNKGKDIRLERMPAHLAEQHEFAYRWRRYSRHAKAFGEQTLGSASPGSTDTYRVTMLPTFAHPLCVRIQIGPNGRATAVAKRLSGRGGYGPAKLDFERTRDLTKKEAKALMDAVVKAGFWEMSPTNEDQGLDGTTWILEGRAEANYHLVARWWPEAGDKFHQLCLRLLDLGGLKQVDAYLSNDMDAKNDNADQDGGGQPATRSNSR